MPPNKLEAPIILSPSLFDAYRHHNPYQQLSEARYISSYRFSSHLSMLAQSWQVSLFESPLPGWKGLLGIQLLENRCNIKFKNLLLHNTGIKMRWSTAITFRDREIDAPIMWVFMRNVHKRKMSKLFLRVRVSYSPSSFLIFLMEAYQEP